MKVEKDLPRTATVFVAKQDDSILLSKASDALIHNLKQTWLRAKYRRGSRSFCDLKQAKQHVLGRLTLYILLDQNRSALDLDEEWSLSSSLQTFDKGRPLVVTANRSKPIFASISHSGAWAVACVSRECRIGIDLEDLGSCPEGFKDWILSDEERRGGFGFGHETLRAYWVGKEAVLKAIGIGLIAGPKAVSLEMPELKDIDDINGQTVRARAFDSLFSCEFHVFRTGEKKMIYCVAHRQRGLDRQEAN